MCMYMYIYICIHIYSYAYIQEWRSPLYANGIGAGALTLIVSSAKILISQR